jgi:glycosyltransferase involved in cell wall biosynthesis
VSSTRPKVLLIAEMANPEWVSVPLEGWSHAKAISAETDAHLVTQLRNKEAIERTGWREGVEFTAIDSEFVAAPIHHANNWLRKVTGLGWTLTTALESLPYYAFEYKLWERFGPAIQAGAYDIVHRLTPLSPTMPSLIVAKRCEAAKVPFIWGPVNGGVPWPKGFHDVQHAEGEWLSYVRDAHKLLPGYRNTRKRASALIAGSMSAYEQFGDYLEKVVYIPENAVATERFPEVTPTPAQGPMRVAFVGRLVPYKGADMLIRASAALVKAGKLVVDIIGDGPEMPALRALREAEGIESGVLLDGWVPHEKLQSRLRQSQLFGFPSVREFGGAVVLEAMATGLVPIVVGYAGPNELVSDATGVRVAIGSRDEIVSRVRAALERFVADPTLVAEMGGRARGRAMSLFTWTAKARQVREVYRWVLGERDKPNFGMPLPDAAPSG